MPLLTPALSSLWIGLVTPVDAGVARPLVEGLATETVVTDPRGMELFDVEPTPLDEAMRAALAEREPASVARHQSCSVGEGPRALLLDAAGLVAELEPQRVDHRPGQQRRG